MIIILVSIPDPWTCHMECVDTIYVQNITHVVAVRELMAEEKSRQRTMEEVRDIDDKQQPTIDRRCAMTEADGVGGGQ